jgi:hypothetical protein
VVRSLLEVSSVRGSDPEFRRIWERLGEEIGRHPGIVQIELHHFIREVTKPADKFRGWQSIGLGRVVIEKPELVALLANTESTGQGKPAGCLAAGDARKSATQLPGPRR